MLQSGAQYRALIIMPFGRMDRLSAEDRFPLIYAIKDHGSVLELFMGRPLHRNGVSFGSMFRVHNVG